MEREIKFKYVVKSDQGITCFVLTLDEIQKRTGNYEAIEAFFKSEISAQIIARLEFTGLKDKNGVEIYEGDIVMWKEIKAVIRYSPQKACFDMNWVKQKEGRNIHYYELLQATTGGEYFYDERIEVIGKIHQHPELLTESKK